MVTHTFRLLPRQDLLNSIESYLQEQHITAGCVIACVGSLNHALIRLADRDAVDRFEGKFEIVSLTGTVSLHGSHLHISVSDSDGKTFGGHLVEGCEIYTTAEIVIAEIPGQDFVREPCHESGYPELVVRNKEAG